MLNPNQRHLLLDILRPPPGMIFSGAVTTTYTLDLTTLLSVPLHLTMLSAGNRDELMKDGIALVEALRRTVSKVAVYCQHGRIAAPRLPHVLYGLLEPSIIEVNPPNGGVFHPKIWLLRFEDPGDPVAPPLIRLIVLSRNLTPDRCWDISLMLEGLPRGKPVGKHRRIAEFMARLPSLASKPPSAPLVALTQTLADQLRQTEWDELPAGFDEVGFHVLGMKRERWLPTDSDRIAVISPFVTSEAIEALAETANEPVALVSRPEELSRIPAAKLRKFKSLHVLHEQAESEDGEDTDLAGNCLRGLHAKVYLTERSWYTTLYTGSANATSASLLSASNVDVLVELTGRTSKVGGIDDLLGAEGIGGILCEFVPPATPPEPTIEERAEESLNRLRDALARSNLRAKCEPAGNDSWLLQLRADAQIALNEVASARAWPVSVRDDFASDVTNLGKRIVPLGPMATASLTGLVAFELKSSLCDLSICFVLNVPVENLPASRDAAVMRTILANREGFLRYLLLLLQADDKLPDVSELVNAIGGSWRSGSTDFGELPLLEELTRAYCRAPEKLRSIKRLVEQLVATPEGRELIPEEFMELWQLYEPLVGEAAV